MKKLTLLAAALLSLTGFLQADKADPSLAPYYITVDGGYGRPFSSPGTGFAGSKSNAFDVDFSFEYRRWNSLSLGLEFQHLGLSQGTLTSDLGSLDLIARILPFERGARSVEPYALIGLGGLVYSNTSLKPYARDNSYHANVQLGLLANFSPAWAVNISVGYQSFGPPNLALNYGDLKVGVQSRFGAASAKTVAKKAKPEVEAAPDFVIIKKDAKAKVKIKPTPVATPAPTPAPTPVTKADAKTLVKPIASPVPTATKK